MKKGMTADFADKTDEKGRARSRFLIREICEIRGSFPMERFFSDGIEIYVDRNALRICKSLHNARERRCVLPNCEPQASVGGYVAGSPASSARIAREVVSTFANPSGFRSAS